MKKTATGTFRKVPLTRRQERLISICPSVRWKGFALNHRRQGSRADRAQDCTVLSIPKAYWFLVGAGRGECTAELFRIKRMELWKDRDGQMLPLHIWPVHSTIQRKRCFGQRWALCSWLEFGSLLPGVHKTAGTEKLLKGEKNNIKPHWNICRDAKSFHGPLCRIVGKILRFVPYF